MTCKPTSKAVENSLKETMLKCGFYSQESTKNEEVEAKLPGAKIEEIPAYSAIKQVHDSKNGSRSPDGPEIRLGFPVPLGTWVEAEARFDGQDGEQWDQLIKDPDESKISEDKLSNYKHDGETIA